MKKDIRSRIVYIVLVWRKKSKRYILAKQGMVMDLKGSLLYNPYEGGLNK
jgi:hypothetical protein